MLLSFDRPTVILLAAMLTSCAPSTARNNPLDPHRTTGGGIGSLAGTVVDGSSVPVAGVSVSTTPSTSSATTDSLGRYTISDISSGAYTITGKKSGLIKTSMSVIVAANATTTASTLTMSSGPSYAGSIQPIFSGNCNASGCHGSSPANGYALTSYAGATAKNVTPFDADGSLLFKRISGSAAGSRMPLGSSALSSADQLAIKNWIDSGAPNN